MEEVDSKVKTEKKETSVAEEDPEDQEETPEVEEEEMILPKLDPKLLLPLKNLLSRA